MPECINLKERFGEKLKVTYEESYEAERGPNAWAEDPWMMIIPCKHGHIYPHGGDTLIVETEGHFRIKAAMGRLDCCQVHQDGDDFGSFRFDVADMAKVAQVVKPYRKRQISDAERQRLAGMGFQRSSEPLTSAVEGDLRPAEAVA